MTCGPVSQTRVCEPLNKGDSSTRTAPELTSRWSKNRPAQVSPLEQANRIQQPYNRSQRSSAHTVPFIAAAYSADLPAALGGSEVPVPVGKTSTCPRLPANCSFWWYSPSTSGGGTRSGSGRSRARPRRRPRAVSRPATDPDRAAKGAHAGGAVAGSEQVGTGHAPAGQSLDHPTVGRVGAVWKLQLLHGTWPVGNLTQYHAGSAATKLFHRSMLLPVSLQWNSVTKAN